MATVGNAREVDINGNDNSLEIEEIARYAVQEHNNKENALLEFGKVLRVTKKVVSGTLYDVKFEATDGGQKKVYEAKVWVKPWESFKELQEFKLVGESDTA